MQKLTQMFSIGCSLLTVVIAINTPYASADQDSLKFFPKNSAATVFGDDVKTLMPRFDTQEDVEEPVMVTQPVMGQPEVIAPPVEEAPESLRERLSKKYGDPNSPPPLRVQDSAPIPFKGMMEALEAGDDELAYEYAQQYTKLIKKLQRANKRVISMVGQVMKEDSPNAGLAWDKLPIMPEDQAIADKKQEEKIAALLKRAEAAEVSRSEDDEQKVSSLIMSRERSKIRAHIKEMELPRDATSVVDAYIFVDPLDFASTQFLREAESLFRSKKGEENINVIALAIRNTSKEAIAESTKRLKITIPLRDGRSLAKKLGIRNSPTIAFLSSASNDAVVEEGYRTFEYMDELLKEMVVR